MSGFTTAIDLCDNGSTTSGVARVPGAFVAEEHWAYSVLDSRSTPPPYKTMKEKVELIRELSKTISVSSFLKETLEELATIEMFLHGIKGMADRHINQQTGASILVKFSHFLETDEANREKLRRSTERNTQAQAQETAQKKAIKGLKNLLSLCSNKAATSSELVASKGKP
jgi:hypothetical protein